MSTTPPNRDKRDLRVTWGGHSTVLIELDGVRLVADPVLRKRVLHLVRHVPPPGPDLLRDPDAILISHQHPDHLDLPSLKLYRRETRVIAPAGTRRILTRAGFSNVTELRAGESTKLDTVEVTAVHAEHDGRRYPLMSAGDTIGFLVAGHRTVYFAGDTDFDPGLRESVPEPDVALLPIWGWGHKLGAGHMDPRGAARAAALIRPRLTVPIHWGTYFPLGLKRFRGGLLKSPAVAFEQQMAQQASGLDFRVLSPGGSVSLPGSPDSRPSP